MSPLKHQQLINLINKLDLPAERVRTLGEDLMAIRCGVIPDWISYVMAMLNGSPIFAKYLVATS